VDRNATLQAGATGEFTTAKGGTVTISANGDFSYIPPGDVEKTPEGGLFEDSFTYTVTDGSAESEAASVTIRVEGRNDAPVRNASWDAEHQVFDVNLDLDEDVSTQFNLLATALDIDAGDILSVSGLPETSANGARLSFGEDGAVTYTADPGSEVFKKLADGEEFIDTITYWVRDDNGGLSEAMEYRIKVIGRNEAPSAVDVNLTLAENGAQQLTSLLDAALDADTQDTLKILSVQSLTEGVEVTLGDDGKTVTFNPGVNFDALNASQTGKALFTFTVVDDKGAAVTATATVDITGANDAPVLAKDVVKLSTVKEDSDPLNLKGSKVSSLFPLNSASPAVTDVDSGAKLQGVLVVGLAEGDAEAGTWQWAAAVKSGQAYAWQDIPVDAEGGFFLASTAQVRFVPAEDFYTNALHAVPSLLVKPIDDQGATTEQAAKVSVTVSAVADAPTVGMAGGEFQVIEDAKSDLIRFGLNDADGSEVKYYAVSRPEGGELYREWTDSKGVVHQDKVVFEDAGGNPTQYVFFSASQAAGGFRFLPDADSNASGVFNVYAATSKSVNALSAPTLVSVAVTPVNDAPVAEVADPAGTSGDTASINPFASFTLSDKDPADSFVLTVTADPGYGAFLLGEGWTATEVEGAYTITVEGAQEAQALVRGLAYVPTANLEPSETLYPVSFGLTVADAETAKAGKVNVELTSTVQLVSENDLPTAGTMNIDLDSGKSVTLTPSLFGFQDVDADAAFTTLRIITLPGTGLLTLDGVELTAPTDIAVEDIAAGRLVYGGTTSGTFGIGFQVGDGFGFSTQTYTMTLSVLALPGGAVQASLDGGGEGGQPVVLASTGFAPTILGADTSGGLGQPFTQLLSQTTGNSFTGLTGTGGSGTGGFGTGTGGSGTGGSGTGGFGTGTGTGTGGFGGSEGGFQTTSLGDVSTPGGSSASNLMNSIITQSPNTTTQVAQTQTQSAPTVETFIENPDDVAKVFAQNVDKMTGVRDAVKQALKDVNAAIANAAFNDGGGDKAELVNQAAKDLAALVGSMNEQEFADAKSILQTWVRTLELAARASGADASATLSEVKNRLQG